MGISHEYHSTSRRRRGGAGGLARLAGAAAGILLVSFAITVILEHGQKQTEELPTVTANGTAQNILAPLPMQGGADSSADSTAPAADGTAAVTGGLIGAMMSPLTPYWVPALGAAFAIVVVKMPFGGTGRNVFNPAAAGMAVVTHCFSTRLFLYPDPSLNAPLALSGNLGKALTEMSPAAQLAGGGSPTYSWAELAIGRFPGPIGATCIAVLAACALYLFTRRTASPLITLSFLAVCALSAILFPRLKDAAWQQSVMMELCSGYLLFAGIFLLNDPVTAPRHWLGRLLYGAFAGILVMALRYFGRFEDAACFAVLLVNAFAPILDRWSWRLVHTLTKGLRPAEEGGC